MPATKFGDLGFADSALEGNGFEPLVPGDMRMRLARDDQVKWSTRLSESIRAMPTPRLHMFAKSDRGAPLMDAPIGRRLVVFKDKGRRLPG